MNPRLQRVNWTCPYELRNAKTQFVSEITPKKKMDATKTKLKKNWILKYPRQLHVLEGNFEF